MNFEGYSKEDFIDLINFWLDCRNHFLEINDKHNVALCNYIAASIEKKMLEVI